MVVFGDPLAVKGQESSGKRLGQAIFIGLVMEGNVDRHHLMVGRRYPSNVRLGLLGEPERHPIIGSSIWLKGRQNNLGVVGG